MTANENRIYLGVVDFAEPTLLFVGHPDSFRSLARQISKRRAFTLECDSGKRRFSVAFVHVTHDDLLSRNGDRFEWRISETEAEVVVQKLLSLSALDNPGHVYLDPIHNVTGCEVVASVGEYSDDIFLS